MSAQFLPTTQAIYEMSTDPHIFELNFAVNLFLSKILMMGMKTDKVFAKNGGLSFKSQLNHLYSKLISY
ncbi:hypothetical protein AS4_15300 [Acinetobacter guillouiae]|nr:hypothetical protein AS4_15300 [Acinetobacter guillouiae]